MLYRINLICENFAFRRIVTSHAKLEAKISCNKEPFTWIYGLVPEKRKNLRSQIRKRPTPPNNRLLILRDFTKDVHTLRLGHALQKNELVSRA